MKNKICSFLLAAVIIAGLMLCVIPRSGNGPNGPTVRPTLPPFSTVPSTAPPATRPPTEQPTIPPTEPPSEPPTLPPTEPDREMIGTLYSRAELMAMENQNQAFGPGYNQPGERPLDPVRLQSKYSQYGTHFIGPDEKNMFLTFDCGYEYEYRDENGRTVRVTAEILDILKAKNVKGIFFVTMHYCEANPDLVRRMIDEGHIVGNHTNKHPVMPTLTIDRMVYEVMSLHEYVQEHFGYTMHYFRPPEGRFSTRTLAVLQSLGYETVHWSFGYRDWDPAQQPDPAEALERIVSSAHNGAIYLLHAVSTTNAAVLGTAIDTLKEQGYSFQLLP